MTFPWTLFNFYSWTCRRCCYRILKLFIKIVKILSIASCIKVFCTIIQWLTLQRCFTARRVWDCTSWLTSAPLWSSHVLSCFFSPPLSQCFFFYITAVSKLSIGWGCESEWIVSMLFRTHNKTAEIGPMTLKWISVKRVYVLGFFAYFLNLCNHILDQTRSNKHKVLYLDK